MKKPQMKAGTHDNSDDKHVVLHAQNDRWGVGPMETSISGANHAVLHA